MKRYIKSTQVADTDISDIQKYVGGPINQDVEQIMDHLGLVELPYYNLTWPPKKSCNFRWEFRNRSVKLLKDGSIAVKIGGFVVDYAHKDDSEVFDNIDTVVSEIIRILSDKFSMTCIDSRILRYAPYDLIDGVYYMYLKFRML